MKKVILIFLLFFICLSTAFSQIKLFSSPKDSVKFNNRKYKQEIGLGIEGILKGNLGSALVWKVRDDRSKLVPVSYSNYWRFQLIANGYSISGAKDSINVDNGLFYYTNPPYEYNNVAILIGRERNNFSNHFNFYYGWEAGPTFGRYKNSSFLILLTNQNNYYIGVESWRVGVAGDALFGVKYHITDRISLSIEAAFSLGYSLIRQRSTEYAAGANYNSEWGWRQNFSYYFDYLRFITINYHFKEY